MPDPDGRRAHLLTEASEIITLDVGTMQEVAPRVRLQPIGGQIGHFQAVLTRDGRYLVTNRPRDASINVADLVERTTWTLGVPDEAVAGDAPSAGGVAINHGPVNADVLALHGYDRVVLYAFGDPHAPLAALGRFTVGRPANAAEVGTGPSPSVAWSATGSHVIAAASDGAAEFAAFEVDDCGRRIVRTRTYTACADATYNAPNDILTANGLTGAAPGAVVPCPRPPVTPDILPTPTPGTPTALPVTPTSARVTLTAAPTLTAEPTVTAIATTARAPLALYLPLVVREHCAVKHLRADIVLVIDTSSSMAGAKLADAKAAARGFVALTDLAAGRDQVAVVQFDQAAVLAQGLGRDRAAIEVTIAGLATRQGTYIDRGLRTAGEELAGPRREPANRAVIVLLTDGRQSTAPGDAEPGAEVRAAEEARGAGIVVYTIGLGADVDAAALQTMAGDSRRAFLTPRSADLARIYGEVAQDIACPGARFWPRR